MTSHTNLVSSSLFFVLHSDWFISVFRRSVSSLLTCSLRRAASSSNTADLLISTVFSFLFCCLLFLTLVFHFCFIFSKLCFYFSYFCRMSACWSCSVVLNCSNDNMFLCSCDIPVSWSCIFSSAALSFSVNLGRLSLLRSQIFF